MYKRLKSKLLAAALTLALIPSTFTCTALAAEVTDPPLVKATGYQDFPAYYEDSHHLPNQVTHPDVVVRDEAWNGYRYWAIYTPNVTRTSIYENPSIVASNDGAHWEAPVGLTNPIDPQPSSTRYHNCDADMIYNPEMDAMMGYWNWADDQAGGVGAEVRLRISYDGVHWGIPVTYDAQTRTWTKPTTEEERQVVSGPTDFIPAVTSSARYDMLSPTFVYDSFRDIFMMWSNNTGDVGYNNGQSNFVELRYSDDGITWGQPTRVNNFLGTNESGQQLAPWHQDVQYVPELKEFLCISQCFSGGNPDGSVLHFTKSKDGLNWEPVGNKPLLSPGEDGSWDDFQIYRSSFYYDPGEEVGNGMIRVWYSALQKNTNNILVADSSGNKTLQAKDQDDRIWRIGYASNSYIAMMKSLMNDSEYAEFTFTGTAVRVYAEMSFNFGTADVYLDGELVENVILYGQAATGQLMFERTGLTDGEHTIRFARNAWNINLDYFSYLPSEQEENVIVDAMDNRITYTGSWNDDQNDSFQNGTARYASGAGATAEFAFNGTAIRWYGQHDTNFGTARVYIDDVLIQEVNVNGAFEAQQLLFERTGLSAGSHVLRIVCESPVIDIDYLVYSNET